MVVVCGPSGSGKLSLIKAVQGLERTPQAIPPNGRCDTIRCASVNSPYCSLVASGYLHASGHLPREVIAGSLSRLVFQSRPGSACRDRSPAPGLPQGTR